MAVTYSGLVNTVIGDVRMVVFNATCSAAEEEIGSNYHGLKNILAANVGVASGATLCTTLVYVVNKDSTAVVSAGCIGFSGAVGAVSHVMRWTVFGY